jgi:predicted nucleotidyltransferase
MEDTATILKEIKAAVQQVDADAQVILFGSRARGDYRQDSDWDVLVLTDNLVAPTFKREVLRTVLRVELEHSIGISTIIRNRVDWVEKFSITPFYKEVVKDGVFI